MLKKEGPALLVTSDTPTDFQVSSKTMVDRIGRPLFVAAVQIKKSYVSYHLMPVYAVPALLDGLSPQLRKRMQGKACFNFTTIDDDQLKELAVLTRTGFAKFKKVKVPW
jgi:hypothetical protein